jgi:hypothetical protein
VACRQRLEYKNMPKGICRVEKNSIRLSSTAAISANVGSRVLPIYFM